MRNFVRHDVKARALELVVMSRRFHDVGRIVGMRQEPREHSQSYRKRDICREMEKGLGLKFSALLAFFDGCVSEEQVQPDDYNIRGTAPDADEVARSCVSNMYVPDFDFWR
jgi:hypothetical protein